MNEPMDVLQLHPIRKSKKQKLLFATDVSGYVEGLGYSMKLETGRFGCKNLIMGDPETAKYVVTAHYDTPASIGLPNFLTPRNPVTYLLYQFLVVGLYLALAFGVGYGVYALTHMDRLALVAGYITYFGMMGLMLLGPANRHNANDNTSGVVTVLELAKSLPEENRKGVCFVLFDLEEAGLIGSGAYRKAHKQATDRQIVINLDCVGDGDHFLFMPSKKARKDTALLDTFCRFCSQDGEKTLELPRKGFLAGSSDHKNFPKGIGVMAFHKAKGIGLYCDRIHTWRDTILDKENVAFLVPVLLRILTQSNDNP